MTEYSIADRTIQANKRKDKMPNLRSKSKDEADDTAETQESTSGPGGVAVGGVAVGRRKNPRRGATGGSMVEDDSEDSVYEEQSSSKRKRTSSPTKGSPSGSPGTKETAKDKQGKKQPRSYKKKKPKATQESKNNVSGAAIGDALQRELQKAERTKLEKNYKTRLLTAWKNCLQAVQVKSHAEEGENFNFVGGIDLRAITTPGGNHVKKKKDRLLAYSEFREAHPNEWDEFMCADGVEGSFGEFVFAADEEKEKYYIPKVHKKHKKRGNLVEAVAGVDLKLAMIVKNLSPHMSVSLAQMYGDVEEGGYTHKFVQNSIAIHFCRDDNRLWELFQKEEAVQRKAAMKASKHTAPGWVNEELAPLSEDLFKKSKLRGKEEEERMKSEGGVLGGGPDPDIEEHSDTDGPKKMTAFVQKATRIAGKHLERETQTGEEEEEEGNRKRSFASLYKASRKSKGGWEELDEFYDGVNLDPTFMTSKRATYMLDSQFVSKGAGMGGRSGDLMQPDDMNKAGISAADSSLHSKAGRNAHLLLTDTIAKAVYTAVTESYDTEGPDECELTDGPDVEVDKKGLMHEYRQSLQEKLTMKSWETCKLNSGTIRQCINPIHQQLHLDNNLTLNDKTVKKIMMQEKIEPEDWVKLGYVVDLPLSKEGLWLRVGIPDAKNSTIFMHWVYVPYGSMLIRSMALLHGGHYGSPGNCRFHGTFMINGQELDSQKLAYLSRMRPDVVCDLSDWKLRWSPNIPKLAWPENGFRALTCTEWQTGMRVGTTYYNNSINPLLPHPFGQNCLKNLNPYTSLTGIDERTSKVNFIWDWRKPEAATVATAADQEERRRIAKLLAGFGTGYVPNQVEEHEESDPGEEIEEEGEEGAEDGADDEAEVEPNDQADNEAEVEPNDRAEVETGADSGGADNEAEVEPNAQAEVETGADSGVASAGGDGGGGDPDEVPEGERMGNYGGGFRRAQPGNLAPGWVMEMSRTQRDRAYYVNQQTGRYTWNIEEAREE